MHSKQIAKVNNRANDPVAVFSIVGMFLISFLLNKVRTANGSAFDLDN